MKIHCKMIWAEIFRRDLIEISLKLKSWWENLHEILQIFEFEEFTLNWTNFVLK